LEKFFFEILAEDGLARRGRIRTSHGFIETPAFVPVATRAAVRSITAADLSAIGAQVLITNAFHLHLHPGEEIIQHLGGLHCFMGWEGPIIMDSGGFQVFSLGMAKENGGSKLTSIFSEGQGRRKYLGSKKGQSLVTVTAEGVEFVSYRDGSRHLFTPEQVVNAGRRLGVDMIMVLDECTSPVQSFRETQEAMERTHRWATAAVAEFHKKPSDGQSLFGIIQGGTHQDLREKSARFIAGQGFDGYALGGFLGNSGKELVQILNWTIPYLCPDKPRHFLGIGLVEDIFEMVFRGIDLFDCIAPTQMAGTGTFFTKRGQRFRMHILNEAFRNDPRPVEEDCDCTTCRNHSRAYLRHLFVVKEPLAVVLAALHNLHFMESLMKEIRQAIQEGKFEALRRSWTDKK
jgi:queuine tRNA-ribosyltransferase